MNTRVENGWSASHRRSCARRARQAVSLVELLVVTLVLALLAAVAMPRMSNLMRRQRLDLAARQVAADVRRARLIAIRTKNAQTVIFEPEAMRYRLPNYVDPHHPDREYTVSMLPTNEWPIQLVGACFGGPSAVTFDHLGVPSASGSVMLTDGVEQAVITVASTTGAISRRIQSDYRW